MKEGERGRREREEGGGVRKRKEFNNHNLRPVDGTEKMWQILHGLKVIRFIVLF